MSKLGDFGFAERISALAHSSIPCGTLQYAAPEILQGREQCPKVDIWSMGIVAYILMGGYPPFFTSENGRLFREIMHGDFLFHTTYWGHVSLQAKDFITQMLKVDPAERPSAKDMLDHCWLRGCSPVGYHSLYSQAGVRDRTIFSRYKSMRKFRIIVLVVIASNTLSQGHIHEQNGGERRQDGGDIEKRGDCLEKEVYRGGKGHRLLLLLTGTFWLGRHQEGRQGTEHNGRRAIDNKVYKWNGWSNMSHAQPMPFKLTTLSLKSQRPARLRRYQRVDLSEERGRFVLINSHPNPT
ncbi:unnamed protein product [Choristocarpus tenellus]